VSEHRRTVRGLVASVVLATTIVALEWSRHEQIGFNSPEIAGKHEATLDALRKENGSPAEISARGWWQILKRTFLTISDNELMSEAASVTFYVLLSLFPALAAMVSLYGLVADPKMIADHLDALANVIPSGGMDIISDQVKRLTENPSRKLGVGAAIGLATAIWSANQGSKALFSALNVVYGEKERRGFIKLTIQSLTFTMGALIFVLFALLALIVLPLVMGYLGLTANSDRLFAIARWPAIVVVTSFFLACLYRFGPSHIRPKWKWVTWGGAFAAVTWVALSGGFSWYVEHFGSYNKTYGSLGAIIGFMTWIWLSTTVILVGAQLNVEAEREKAREAFPK
jgi:membrane protein